VGWPAPHTGVWAGCLRPPTWNYPLMPFGPRTACGKPVQRRPSRSE
jgi:hypothetical protein